MCHTEPDGMHIILQLLPAKVYWMTGTTFEDSGVSNQANSLLLLLRVALGFSMCPQLSSRPHLAFPLPMSKGPKPLPGSFADL
jgi:hypothetical protein